MNTMVSTAGRARRTLDDVWIALGLSTGAAVSLGFSRFAYALLLPPMRASLHWSYVQAGGMNTLKNKAVPPRVAVAERAPQGTDPRAARLLFAHRFFHGRPVKPAPRRGRAN